MTWDVLGAADRDTSRGGAVPTIVPETRQKQRLGSQRQPTRSICEVEESEWFTMKTEDVQEADFRLANRRLQPLGHLTARELSIRHASTYARPIVPIFVPETVPADLQNHRGTAPARARSAIRMQRFFSPTTMPATDWRAPLYSHEPASTYLASRASGMPSARKSGGRTGPTTSSGVLNRYLSTLFVCDD